MSRLVEITPAILGPGIEEEYADALAAIGELRAALGARPLTNSTPDGRLLLEIAWLEQEIGRRRLPIPVDASYAGTVYYLVGSGELDRVPGVRPALSRLWIVLQGYGLIKPRHMPVLIDAIETLCDDIRPLRPGVPNDEQAIVQAIASWADMLRRGERPTYRPPQDRFNGLDLPVLAAEFPELSNRLRGINTALFDGWRPYRARKGPLPAPVPGLPPEAPPLPPELEGRLP